MHNNLTNSIKSLEHERKDTINDHLRTLSKKKEDFKEQLKQKMENELMNKIEEVKTEEMKKKLEIQLQALNKRRLLNDKYSQYSNELVREQNSMLLELQNETQINNKKLELTRKCEYNIQKLKTDIRIDLLNLDKKINNIKINIKGQYDISKDIEELDINFTNNLKIKTEEYNKEINDNKKLKVLLKNIYNDKGELHKLQQEIKFKKKDLEVKKGELELIILEYKRQLKNSYTINKENINENNNIEMQKTITELSNTLNLKEQEIDKLKEFTPNTQDLELLKLLTDIKKRLSPNTNYIPTATLNEVKIINNIEESDIDNIKMKTICVALTNEAKQLEQQHKSLLNDYRTITKLMKLISNNNTEWLKHIEKSSLWKLDASEVQVNFIRQIMQLEHQLRVTMY